MGAVRKLEQQDNKFRVLVKWEIGYASVRVYDQHNTIWEEETFERQHYRSMRSYHLSIDKKVSDLTNKWARD